MGRTVALVWHASFAVIAAALYFLFVLPRWWELTDKIPTVLGTVLRIVTAVVIGLSALPVVFTWIRTRKPEFGVPQLALTLRVASIVAHVLAAVLIAGTAISEIWLSLDAAGQWLFGIYGAAAAVALLGIAGFYLSFLAEKTPPPPKPLKPKKPKQRRRDRKKAKRGEDADTGEGAEEADADEGGEEAEEAEGGEDTEDGEQGPTAEADGTGEAETGEKTEEAAAGEGGKLRNRRPSGKSGRRQRLASGKNVSTSDD